MDNIEEILLIKNILLSDGNVNSSVIKSVHYDLPLKIFTINFRDGRNYTYYNFPLGVYIDLMTSSSKGQYYNANIRGKY